uniref:Uncharacterized protein n=1 Tax=Hemiselmis andersenii TaxID=464988 RepID=A0A6U4JT78_HEMAN|mmetsp:Transcript_30657/g.71631  ORF Transcript_30657/g.71631 Transcript_30657/m.71631 type:complete len:180 (-) Transcript_30657:191-730(-)|eukprot:CAMPEP_0114131098 /NCGR_PEP_ID=MMETSP0043_2-20121206/12369_1 /TAXON_ID=464988 /ORGANISM="Hemiselmis andersenii, Strain CCMP644" /LENGTH=179 /DNA_ID=CAMNT_0001224501 /DNA_START=9 /DNA_END=548 /DNA_ORIENTATION=-
MSSDFGLAAPRGMSVQQYERQGVFRGVILAGLAVAAVALAASTAHQGARSTALVSSAPPAPPPMPAAFAPPPSTEPVAMPEESSEEPPAQEPSGSYAVQPDGEVYGGVNTAGTVSTGCSGGNCGEAGPTTANGGNDADVADYDKVKSERRFAMDFCDAHFSSWVNVQKCIAELFHNARY